MHGWVFGYGQPSVGSTPPQARIVDESAGADPRPSEQGADSPALSTPKRRKAADQQVRQATTLQLTSLLQGMSGGLSQNSSGSFPWWETATDTTSSETMPPPPYISARKLSHDDMP